MPPPAEGLASRLFLAPALRTQPDRRLIALVRDGYEAAFEEIVRRYGRPLGRYAASIVGSRSEDVTQDAFSKALLAMRRDGVEIKLRPWLFRIVRNTALNELRDSPPSPEMLAEAIAGGSNPADELERREELADLMRRLRELPEAQRAAIVMRELEGLSHEEIAAALGLTGGGARQAIYRARRALRDGIGMLVPLPLMQSLLAAASTPGATETAAGTVGIASAGAGAGMALKATAATVLVAGAVGTGVALNPDPHNGGAEAAPVHASRDPAGGVVSDVLTGADDDTSGEGGRHWANRGRGSGDDRGGHGEAEPTDDRGGNPRSVSGHRSRGDRSGPSGHRGTADGPDGRSGPSHPATSGSGSDSGRRRSGRDESGGGDGTSSGSGGSGSSGSGSNDGGNDGSGSADAIGSDSGSRDGGSSGSGPGGEPTLDGDSGPGSDSGSGSGSSVDDFDQAAPDRIDS